MKQYLFFVALLSMTFFMSCNKDLGKVTVTYQKANAVYGDIDEIRNTPLNSNVRDIVNPGKIYYAQDYILIGEEEHGIHVINNLDPSNPIPVNFIDIPNNREFYVSGNYLFAETQYDLVKINIEDVTQVKLASRIERVFQEELKNDEGETLIGFSFEETTETIDQDGTLYQELLNTNHVYFDYARNIIPQSAVPTSFAGSGQSSGTVNRITVTENHVYVVGRDKLYAIENSTFDQVASVLNFPGEELETVFPYQDQLFIGSRSSMEIVDIANPVSPQKTYSFQHATSCDPVLPVDGAAYITLRTAQFSSCPGNINALIVLDIQNLNQPVEKAEIPMLSPYGMTKIGNTLYVAEGENGLKVFDATHNYDLQLSEYVQDITAYDIIAHPSDPSLILVAGQNELNQYSIKENQSLLLESTISL